jgi:hypothetical protein
VALNIPATEYVFQHFTQFARFTVVPSHSAQAVKYNLTSLTRKGGRHLERRILGFNCHEEPLRIASREATLHGDYSSKSSPMPDLTSFMCELQPGFMGAVTGYVRLVHDGSAILFKRDEGGGDGAIPMCDLKSSRELKAWEVEQILELPNV